MPLICPVTFKSQRRVKKRSHSMQANIVQLKPNFVIKRIGNKKVKVTANALRIAKKKGLSIESLILGNY